LVALGGVAAAAFVVGGVVWLARARPISGTSSAGKAAASRPALSRPPSTVAVPTLIPAGSLGDQSDAATVAHLITTRLGGASSAGSPAAASSLTTVPAPPGAQAVDTVCFAQTQAAVGAAAGSPDTLRFTAALQWRGQPAIAVVLAGPKGLAGAVMKVGDCSLLTVLPF